MQLVRLSAKVDITKNDFTRNLNELLLTNLRKWLSISGVSGFTFSRPIDWDEQDKENPMVMANRGTVKLPITFDGLQPSFWVVHADLEQLTFLGYLDSYLIDWILDNHSTPEDFFKFLRSNGWVVETSP